MAIAFPYKEKTTEGVGNTFVPDFDFEPISDAQALFTEEQLP